MNPILRHQVPAGVTAQTVAVRSPRFADDDPAAPVYTVKVATRRDRIEYRTALTAAGLRYPSDGDLFDCIRQDLRANAADWEKLVEVVDAFEVQHEAVSKHNLAFAYKVLEAPTDEARVALIKDATDRGGSPKIDRDLAAQYAAIEGDVRRNCPAYARLEADRRRYNAITPLLSASLFLVGWSGVPPEWGAFRRDGGRVPDDVLDHIPDADLSAVHGKVIELMSVAEQAAKNFVSPSASSSDRSNSTTGGKRRTARRGKSTESSTH